MNNVAEWKVLQAHTRRIKEIMEQRDEIIEQNNKIMKKLDEHETMLIAIFKKLEEIK